MPMVRAMRVLNAIEAGTLSGSALETLLAGDAGRLAELTQLLQLRGQCRRLAASSTAMNAVIASSTAMNAVAASSTAMNAVAASSTAMNAVAASSTAKMAVFNSDTALNAIAGSATAMAAARAASQYSVVSWTENGATPVSLTLTGTHHIVLGASRNASIARAVTLTTLRSGTTVSGTTPSTAAVASTTATDFNVAIPLVSPHTARLSGSGSVTSYLGILRCDV